MKGEKSSVWSFTVFILSLFVSVLLMKITKDSFFFFFFASLSLSVGIFSDLNNLINLVSTLLSDSFSCKTVVFNRNIKFMRGWEHLHELLMPLLTILDLCLFFPGSLVVERGPARPPITNHQAGPRAEAPTGALTAAQQRQSTLAQLQMQVGFSPQPVALVLWQVDLF